ncbi:MAG: B12-binding domain-containing protein [Pyrinomonadaceae bacterium]|nr:B12-binding domain-containing protein [Pyrinomonadaceae bacterium]
MKERTANFLTTRQLARMWQVSEATIKRWADAGHLHSQKTLGGHRRFALSEVLKFQSERGFDTDGERVEPKRTATIASGAGKALAQAGALERFFEAISIGHEAEATAILLRQYLDRIPPVKILEETVTEALRRVGNRWHSGEMSVADEHLATHTAIRAIEALRSAMRPAQLGERLAVCCTVEDELHDIATLCVQVLLESEGWSVKNLGASMPFFALSDAIVKHRPHLVCISSTTNGALSRYAREYAQFKAVTLKHQTRIALGGEGFRERAIRQRFPADLHAENFNQLLKMI